MTFSFSQAFGGAGGASGFGGRGIFVPVSRSITFPQAGKVCITIVSAGGSGARGAPTAATPRALTGGNSGPWGRRVLTLDSGSTLAFSLGAGGAAQTVDNSSGNPGSTSTVSLNGSVIITAQGGEGGVYNLSSAISQTPVATITGCDFANPGVRAGNATVPGAGTGGAAVDVLSCGLGRSPDQTASGDGLGGSVGTDLGGANTLPYVVLSDFGFSLLDGVTPRGPGVGGTGSVSVGGVLAGSAPRANKRTGFGGGGGADPAAVAGDIGAGGNAYAYVVFQPEE